MHARTLRGILMGAVAGACGGATTLANLDESPEPIVNGDASSSPTPVGTQRTPPTGADVWAFVDARDDVDIIVDANAPGADVAVVDASTLHFTRPFDCNHTPAAYDALRSSLGYDYLEDRRGESVRYPDAGGGWRVVGSAGTKCSGATSKPTCEAAFDSPETRSSFFLYGECGGCYPGGNYLAYTKGDAIGTIATLSELLKATSAIDAPAEAWMVAVARRWSLDCGSEWVAVHPDGFALRGRTMAQDCPIKWKEGTILVRSDGTLEELDTTETTVSGCVGRRPSGLVVGRHSSQRPRARRQHASVVGVHFAEIARLEAASVDAFQILRTELRAHGAPRSILQACSRAARDEVAHARAMARIARRHGGTVGRPRVVRSDVRSLVDIALENAIEGCVRETYGAAEGLFQSRTARDPEIRRAMTAIAADETRHGALSWRVAEWLDAKLTRPERARVRAARDAEVAALTERAGKRRPPQLVAIAGVPTAEHAVEIVASLRKSLWA